jgi:branched-chain amino acid transport system ATP-binding protein
MAERKIGEVILEVKNISLAFGGVKALTDISFDVKEHEIRAIIGPNGAGKTTFFNVVSGFLAATAGRVIFQGRDIVGLKPHQISQLGIARTLQVKSVFNGLTVYDNVWIAAQSRSSNRPKTLELLQHPAG